LDTGLGGLDDGLGNLGGPTEENPDENQNGNNDENPLGDDSGFKL